MECYKLSSMLESIYDPSWSILAWMTSFIMVRYLMVGLLVKVGCRGLADFLEKTKINIKLLITMLYR